MAGGRMMVGPLAADAATYVQRDSDRLVARYLERLDYVQITDPRQQGKTSFLFQLSGLLPPAFRLTYIDTESLRSDSEAAWYGDLASRLRPQLQDLVDFSGAPVVSECSSFRAFLLHLVTVQRGATPQPIVVALDEVGSLTKPWSEGFFRVLREVYTVREFQPEFKRLGFVLVGAFDPGTLIKDGNISPFNVAQSVHFEDFTLSELVTLAERMNTAEPDLIARGIHEWTDGQPYLAHNLCLRLTGGGAGPPSPTQLGDAIRWLLDHDSHHLRALRRGLDKDPGMAASVLAAVKDQVRLTPSLNPLHFKLAYVVGLLKADARGLSRIRNRVYQEAVLDRAPADGEPAPVPPPPAPSRQVISLHGIRTRGAWQKQLNDELQAGGFSHQALDYGNFLALQLLWPASRRRKVEWFRDMYTEAVERHGPRPSVIAHSFGSYLVARAMELFPEISFDQIILCGSIVRSDFPWSRMIETGRVSRLVNEYGHQDVWARVVGWVVDDAGPSGVEGFSDTAGGRVVQRLHPEFRHSDYFYSLNYRYTWVPVLRGEAPPELLAPPVRKVNWRFVAVITASLVTILASFFLLLRSRTGGG